MKVHKVVASGVVFAGTNYIKQVHNLTQDDFAYFGQKND